MMRVDVVLIESAWVCLESSCQQHIRSHDHNDDSSRPPTCLKRIVLRIDRDGADRDVANVHTVVDGVRQFRFVQ